MPESPTVRDVLATAVAALGGEERPGQIEMAEAVADAMTSGEHLLVQAGTGTGKSLAYLVPSLLRDERVVIATATLALQHQLVERDIPALVAALPDVDTSFAVLKGRSNYACLHRVREGVPDDQGTLVAMPEGSMGAEVLKLREWVESETEGGGSGERDNAPRHTDRLWRQVSVNHRECLGATKCPYAHECFAEKAKEKAARSQVIVTNHSLLAIDAIEGVPMIPDYDAVVIDEAHELVARVTQAATDELTFGDVERAGRRAGRYAEGDAADDLLDAGEALQAAIGECAPGRIDAMPQDLGDALQLVRDAARACLSAIPKESEGEADAARTQAKGLVQEVFVNAERMAADKESDVLWLAEGRDRIPPRLYVAPLEVWGPMRDKLLSDKTVVFTSATLRLGGDFGPVATSFGLHDDDVEHPWRGLDVGFAVRLRPAGDPLRRPPPAASWSGRHVTGHPGRDLRAR